MMLSALATKLAQVFDFNSLDTLQKIELATVFTPAVFALVIGLLISRPIIRFLRKQELWRKREVKRAIDGRPAVITQKLNNDSGNKVPRMGGLVIILSASLVTLAFWLISFVDRSGFIHNLNFINRQETYLVVFSLVSGGIIGILDDLAVVERLSFKGKLKQYIGGGIPLQFRLLIATCIGLVCGYWFYYKLGFSSVEIPFVGLFDIGIYIIPLIIVVTIATYSGSIIDGVDGLAGVTFATIFGTYFIIALLQGNQELATFCLVVVGAILSFLWYNVSPAQFYMSETGSMALTITLAILAFQTQTMFLLLIIAFPLLLTSASVIVQVVSKKFRRGKKIFEVAPIHNHFRAKGWTDTQVVMRYLVISQISALSGLAVYLLGYSA